MFYYYIQLNRMPVYSRQVRQSNLYPDYALLECFDEATDKAIDNYKLVYVGRGYITNYHIQKNINKIVERLK